MPMIRIEMLAGRSEAQRIELVDVLSREMSRIANCPVSDIQVIISEVERTHWAMGGVLNQTSVGKIAS
ncbi:tautomerase family protein [Erwinia sp. S63]|uniref:tautomerase family protein n=1 Tax=Erwinia sp. S63 TaxID=2769341 RepID=UPI00190DD830|nr:tautomerase family protein [Erwinia sp. S63]MBK0097532.1 tautomerase family protein [Erwinia sp. S63]